MSERPSVPKTRVYGATIRAYHGGAARIRPWNHSQFFHLFRGEAA